MSKKIYIVEVSKTDWSAAAQFTIAAASSAAAKAFVARQFIEARMAEPMELIGIGASSVIDADTGHPVGAQLAAAQPELPLATPNGVAAEETVATGLPSYPFITSPAQL